MNPLSYSLDTAAEATGLSKSHLERAIRTGTLRAKKSGKNAAGEPVGRWVIQYDALKDYVDGLVDA